jgi:hypothetical protein
VVEHVRRNHLEKSTTAFGLELMIFACYASSSTRPTTRVSMRLVGCSEGSGDGLSSGVSVGIVLHSVETMFTVVQAFHRCQCNAHLAIARNTLKIKWVPFLGGWLGVLSLASASQVSMQCSPSFRKGHLKGIRLLVQCFFKRMSCWLIVFLSPALQHLYLL